MEENKDLNKLIENLNKILLKMQNIERELSKQIEKITQGQSIDIETLGEDFANFYKLKMSELEKRRNDLKSELGKIIEEEKKLQSKHIACVGHRYIPGDEESKNAKKGGYEARDEQDIAEMEREAEIIEKAIDNLKKPEKEKEIKSIEQMQRQEEKRLIEEVYTMSSNAKKEEAELRLDIKFLEDYGVKIHELKEEKRRKEELESKLEEYIGKVKIDEQGNKVIGENGKEVRVGGYVAEARDEKDIADIEREAAIIEAKIGNYSTKIDEKEEELKKYKERIETIKLVYKDDLEGLESPAEREAEIKAWLGIDSKPEEKVEENVGQKGNKTSEETEKLEDTKHATKVEFTLSDEKFMKKYIEEYVKGKNLGFFRSRLLKSKLDPVAMHVLLEKAKESGISRNGVVINEYIENVIKYGKLEFANPNGDNQSKEDEINIGGINFVKSKENIFKRIIKGFRNKIFGPKVEQITDGTKPEMIEETEENLKPNSESLRESIKVSEKQKRDMNRIMNEKIRGYEEKGHFGQKGRMYNEPIGPEKPEENDDKTM